MLVSCWFFVSNFLLSLALRFYCFFIFGRDYASILMLFYLWDVIPFVFLSLRRDYPLILLFFIFGRDYASILMLFYLWDVITFVFLSLGRDYPLILLFFYLWAWLSFDYHVNFFYCNFVSFFHSFHWIFHFFRLFSSFLFFDGSPIDNLYINNHILVINFIITEPVSVGSVPNSALNRLLEPVLLVRLAPTRSGSQNRSWTDRVVPIPNHYMSKILKSIRINPDLIWRITDWSRRIMDHPDRISYWVNLLLQIQSVE